MEMGGSRRVDRTGRTVCAEPTRTEKKGSTQALTKEAAGREDRLALSRQALAFLEKQAREMEQARMEERASRRDGDLSGLSAKKKELDRLDKMMKAMLNCQKIAARIMAGDKVPPEDLRYLEENDPEGFKLALALRKPKKHPKEWDSVLEDEKRSKETASEGTDGPEAVSASGGAPEGGGEVSSGSGEGV